jgi:hypothetical protein
MISLDRLIYKYRQSFFTKRRFFTDKMVAIVATGPSFHSYSQGHSGLIKSGNNKIGDFNHAPELKKKLESLSKTGQIGGESIHRTSIPIGNCAEDMAALRLMIKSNNRIPLKNIIFSKAVRIQTFETIRPCCNCKSTFPSL